MTARDVWLIRHAESAWNAVGRWQGQGDPPLSARGRQQAADLAQQLGPTGLETLVASDLARARETALILANALGLPLRLDPRLRERDLGAWTGLTEGEIAARWPADLERLRAGDASLRPGGGETLGEVRVRGEAALAVLVAEPARRIALVTHLGVIRLLGGGAEPDPGRWCRLRLADLERRA